MTVTDRSTMSITGLAYRIVRMLLQEDELESFEVSPKPPPEERYPFPNDANLWLHISVAGEPFSIPLDGDPSVDALAGRLQSNLQDWIAESSWGWGQQRTISQ